MHGNRASRRPYAVDVPWGHRSRRDRLSTCPRRSERGDPNEAIPSSESDPLRQQSRASRDEWRFRKLRMTHAIPAANAAHETLAIRNATVLARIRIEQIPGQRRVAPGPSASRAGPIGTSPTGRQASCAGGDQADCALYRILYISSAGWSHSRRIHRRPPSLVGVRPDAPLDAIG